MNFDQIGEIESNACFEREMSGTANQIKVTRNSEDQTIELYKAE